MAEPFENYSQYFKKLTPEDEAALLGEPSPNSTQLPETVVEARPEPATPQAAVDRAMAGVRDLSDSAAQGAEVAADKVESAMGKAADVSADAAVTADMDTEDFRMREAERQEALARAQKTFEAAVAKQAEPPAEPERWQKVMSGIVKVLGTIGSASGSAGGAGLAAAMGLIDDKLHEDLVQQLKEKQQAGVTGKLASDQIDILMKGGEDARGVASALQTQRSVAAAHWLNQAANEAKTVEEAQKFRDIAAQYVIRAEETNLNNAQLGLREENQRKEAAASRAVARAGQLAGRNPLAGASIAQLQQRANDPSAEYSAEAAEILAKMQKAQREAHATPPPGYEVKDPQALAARPPEAGTDFLKESVDVKAYHALSSELEALVRKHGTESFGRMSGKMESLFAQLLELTKETGHLGSLDTGVLELNKMLHGDPTSLVSQAPAIVQKLRNTRENVIMRHRLNAEAFGLGAPEFAAPVETTVTPGWPGQNGNGKNNAASVQATKFPLDSFGQRPSTVSKGFR